MWAGAQQPLAFGGPPATGALTGMLPPAAPRPRGGLPLVGGGAPGSPWPHAPPAQQHQWQQPVWAQAAASPHFASTPQVQASPQGGPPPPRSTPAGSPLPWSALVYRDPEPTAQLPRTPQLAQQQQQPHQVAPTAGGSSYARQMAAFKQRMAAAAEAAGPAGEAHSAIYDRQPGEGAAPAAAAAAVAPAPAAGAPAASADAETEPGCSAATAPPAATLPAPAAPAPALVAAPPDATSAAPSTAAVLVLPTPQPPHPPAQQAQQESAPPLPEDPTDPQLLRIRVVAQSVSSCARQLAAAERRSAEILAELGLAQVAAAAAAAQGGDPLALRMATVTDALAGCRSVFSSSSRA